MIGWIHPGLVILLGSLLLPLIKWNRVKKAYFLLLPILALIILILTSLGLFGSLPMSTLHIPFLNYELVLGRIDKLSMVFGYVFVIAAICMNVYALHVDRDWEHVSAMFYVGSTLGVVFAGDLFTLYFFWEIMAWSSLFLIWFRRTEKARAAGFRYILWHLFGGVSLLGGIVLHVQATGSIDFVSFTKFWGLGMDCLPYYLIFLGFIINAAVPPLHPWLSDAYPEATVTGAVYMTAFTTKSAVYALIRGFPGVELLMWLGAIMALYGVVFAVLENDGRRLLAYHIISQVGYMVCGAGIGTAMAINGATAHAFCHILYKALLFMGMGAVIEVTGRSKLTELGGLYKYMPISFWLYMIGAFSISGFPLFNGFVSKTMTVESSALIHQPIVWLLLEGSSIGTFLHTGLKLPWNVWFAREKPADIEAREPPKNMLAGMGLTAFLCIFLGVYPGYKILYDMLPYPVEYHPYALGHVIEMSQLLLFTFIAFWLLREMLRGEPTITLDTDWLVRIPGKKFIWFCEKPLMAFGAFIDQRVLRVAGFIVQLSRNPLVAMRIAKDVASVKVKERVAPSRREEYERGLEEEIRRYPGEVPRFSLGASLLIVFLLFILYLAMYLMA
ncbi:MAG: Na(+)/H(+) antiporter subunit D [Candidatus Methanospirareceae archaeon]